MSESGTDLRISVVADRSPGLEEVIELSKRHQATLGQLPYEAFHTFAQDGRALVARRGNDLAGYAIYRVRKRTGVLVLVHLCVSDDHRGSRVASSLIAAVCDRHPRAPGLALWCREDYPAHRSWPALGFDRTSSRAGKNRAGHQLVHWWRPIDEYTLFTFEPEFESVPAAAIDTNVFRDMVEPRLAFPESIALDDDWLVDSVELVITGQLETEVQGMVSVLPSLQGATARFRRLAPPLNEWQSTQRELGAALIGGSVEDGDVRQLAQASAGGARYFVTRDGPVLAHAELIESFTGLQVVRPLDLALALHADQYESAYRAEALRETAIEIRHPSALPTLQELVVFTDHSQGERTSGLLRELESSAHQLRHGGRLWAIVRPDKERLAIAATAEQGNGLIARGLRVRQDRDRTTFARQLLHRLREEAVVRGLSNVRVLGPTPDYVRAAMAAEGYVHTEDGWRAECPTGLLTGEDIVPAPGAPTPAQALSPDEASQLERRLWPLKLVSGAAPTYIVPIQPQWARALFGDEPREPELFPRPDRLSVAREHVYYRSPSRQLSSPARLLWFVTGGGPNGGMRAVSWLDDVVTGRPGTLYRRFGAQGIYDLDDVHAVARRRGAGSPLTATAMVFSRTETFSAHLPLSRAKEIFPSMGTSQFLRTTRPVSEHVFASFYRAGLLHDD